MATEGILSRLLAKKSSDGQSKPPYPKGNLEQREFTDPDKVWMNEMALGDLTNLGAVPQDMWKYLNAPEQLAQAQYANAQQAQNVHSFPAPIAPNAPATGATLAMRAREMFLKRMGGIRNELRIAPDDYLYCHVYQETVFLFYCFAGRDGCVKENIDLFPSDQLITQFRMVLST